MPELIIVMRHVECIITENAGVRTDGPFASDAEKQAKKVAKHMRKIIGARSVKLLTSDAPRCTITSKTLNGILGYPHFESTLLNQTCLKFHEVLERLFFGKGLGDYQAFLLVTHEAFVKQSLEFVAEDPRLQYKTDLRSIWEIPYGSFLVVDIRERSARLMRN